MMKAPAIQESRWIGRVLQNKWRIDQRIARGGMGTVFAATHKNNGSTAAIKILHPEFSRDSDTRSRFLQEGYAANQVSHPGVVRILDDDVTEEGHAYLVMELLEGELLEQRRIRMGGRLPLDEVYDLADQLLDVLVAAHKKGIVHRDIKPDNIFITKQGRLKVLDFGFAQMKSSYRTEQTATGFLLGTPGFMAPEQAVGNRPLIDARTDIWAVGATMFILLTGEPVHAGESAAEMLVAAANFAVRPIATVDPRLPTKLAAVIDRALAFEKNERWPDAASMQSALRSVPGRPSLPPNRRSRPDEGRLFVSNQSRSPDSSLEAETVRGTAMGAGGEEIVDVDLVDVEETRALPGPRGHHPADDEKHTLAVEPDHATVARTAPPLGPADEHESTVVMETRPQRAPSGPQLASSQPMVPRTGTVRPMAHSTPEWSVPPPPPRASLPDHYPVPIAQPTYGAPPPAHYAEGNPQMSAAPARGAPTGSRVFGFLLVAAITMIVVILVGLVVIMGVD